MTNGRDTSYIKLQQNGVGKTKIIFKQLNVKMTSCANLPFNSSYHYYIDLYELGVTDD